MPSPKERLLTTSTYLFSTQGYNTTGINQIISEANVAKASFYKHFKSKEDLCAAFLNERHKYWFNELIRFTAHECDPKAKILYSFDFLTFMNEKEHFRGCSFLNILTEIPPGNTKILDVIKSHKADLRVFFFDIIGNKASADHIYLLFESCMVESKLFASNELIESAKQFIGNLLN